jgi:hypothetical protein
MDENESVRKFKECKLEGERSRRHTKLRWTVLQDTGSSIGMRSHGYKVLGKSSDSNRVVVLKMMVYIMTEFHVIIDF